MAMRKELLLEISQRSAAINYNKDLPSLISKVSMLSSSEQQANRRTTRINNAVGDLVFIISKVWLRAI